MQIGAGIRPARLWEKSDGVGLPQAGVVLAPFCLELGRHILKMIERDPRRPILSAIVLLGFQSKANHVDRQKKITNLALKELISSTTTALFLLLSVCG